MKIVYCFIFLFHICYCIEDSDGPEKYRWGNSADRIYLGNVNKYNDHKTYGDDHNPIIRPCPLDDLNCIRRVFAHNSKCTPVEGPAQDPYLLRRLDMPIPQANLTFSLLNAQVFGLNVWTIKNFFINKATDRLVLEVVFDRIVVPSPGVRIIFHRKGKEPIEVTDYAVIAYYDISFTLTIPHIKDLQLSKAHVFTYVADAAPPFMLGPAIQNNKDPGFRKAVSVWLDNLGVTIQEVWTGQGPAFMSIFLQSTICDFRHH